MPTQDNELWIQRPDGYYVNGIMGTFNMTYWIITPDMLILNSDPIYYLSEAEELIEQHKAAQLTECAIM